jgi:hypothetical protein
MTPTAERLPAVGFSQQARFNGMGLMRLQDSRVQVVNGIYSALGRMALI